MAHESFEDEQVADYLNEHYVAIKVDREERPDIDHVYMMYCQALTGEGGWPLTVVMTPEGHPFFAGTYFPKSARYGRPGLLDILAELANRWSEDESRLRVASEGITNRLQPIFAASPGEFDAVKAAHTAFGRLSERFDSFSGGFGDAPKFPMFHQMMFLLRYYRYTGENEALLMVDETLQAIAKGGIYDHVGGGLSRYSTDAYWRVPHFEKMLYDNALAVMTYAEVYQQTKKERFKFVAEDILSFVNREMTSPEGAFFAAQDADSEGQEGRFYVWRPDDIAAALGERDAETYCSFYDITEEGNFEGYSVPNYIDTDVASFAGSHGWSEDELWSKLQAWNRQLYAWRSNREHPGIDDKVLTAWNALMIVSLAKAGAAFDEPMYIERAAKSMLFIEQTMIDHENRLLARYRDGEAGILAYADDYAYLVWAYLELYQATLGNTFLLKACEWQRHMDDLFWNSEQHAYMLAGRDAEKLIASPVTAYDGATPSANSVAAYNLARLYAITGRSIYAERVDEMLGAFGEVLEQAPTEHVFLLMAALWAYGGSTEVVIATDEEIDSAVQMFTRDWQQHFLPEAVLLRPLAREEEADGYKVQDGKMTIYVCRHFQCDRPDSDAADAIRRVLNNPPRL